MAQGLYTKGLEQAYKGNVVAGTDTFKLIFLSTSHTFDFTGDSFLSDISADRASGTTDITLTNVAINIDTGNSRVEFDSDDVSQSSVTTSTDKYAIYKSTGTDTTSPLIFGGTIAEGTLTPTNGTISLTINAQGYFSIPTS